MSYFIIETKDKGDINLANPLRPLQPFHNLKNSLHLHTPFCRVIRETLDLLDRKDQKEMKAKEAVRGHREQRGHQESR